MDLDDILQDGGGTKIGFLSGLATVSEPVPMAPTVEIDGDDTLSQPSSHSVSRKKSKKPSPEQQRGRRQTRGDRAKMAAHLKDAGVHGSSMMDYAGKDKLVLKRLSRNPSRCQLMLVDGKSPEAYREQGSQSFANKMPFKADLPPQLEEVEGSDSADDFEFDMGTFRFHADDRILKQINDRKRVSLNTLSLKELENLINEMTNIHQEAKRRAQQIEPKLRKIKPDIEKEKKFLTAKQLLNTIALYDTTAVSNALKDAIALEDTLPRPVEPQSPDHNDSPPYQNNDRVKILNKKKEKKKSVRCHFTAKGLWDNWDTFWRYPDAEDLAKHLKTRSLPPFRSESGSSFDVFHVPELGPHYKLSQQEKEAFQMSLNSTKQGYSYASAPDIGASRHSLHQRLLSGLLVENTIPAADKHPKKKKAMLMDPGIRAVLSGRETDGTERLGTPVTPLGVGPLENKRKRKAQGSLESRIMAELATIDVLGPETQVQRLHKVRGDGKLHITLRDMQVKLYRQQKDNDSMRLHLQKSISQLGVGLDVEKKLAKVEEAYKDLTKAYKQYKKKGISATGAQVDKALTNVQAAKKNYGTRPSLTGVYVNPKTIDGIPRNQMNDYVQQYNLKKTEFRGKHPPIELSADLNTSSSLGLSNGHSQGKVRGDKGQMVVRSQIHANCPPSLQYLPSHIVFPDGDSESESEEDSGQDDDAAMDLC